MTEFKKEMFENLTDTEAHRLFDVLPDDLRRKLYGYIGDYFNKEDISTWLDEYLANDDPEKYAIYNSFSDEKKEELKRDLFIEYSAYLEEENNLWYIGVENSFYAVIKQDYPELKD